MKMAGSPDSVGGGAVGKGICGGGAAELRSRPVKGVEYVDMLKVRSANWRALLLAIMNFRSAEVVDVWKMKALN